MIKVRNAESGAEAWIRAEHVSKVWKRLDGVICVRMSNGETLIVEDRSADDLAASTESPLLDILHGIRHEMQRQSTAIESLRYEISSYLSRNQGPSYPQPAMGYYNPQLPNNYYLGQSIVIDADVLAKLQLADQIKALK